MVLVTFRHTDCPVKESGMPVGGAGKSAAQSMFLDIRLVHYVKSERITELIPTGMIGIMACADGIDVRLLHKLYILDHSFFGHDTGGQRIMLVTVHAAEAYRLTVDKNLTVLHLHTAETDLALRTLHHVAKGIGQSKVEGIKVRSLGGPGLGIPDNMRYPAELAGTALRIPFIHDRCLVV